MTYQIKLGIFEGPLDLLLHLIKEQEVDIYDIPIAKITQQYLEYLDLMCELNLEVAGEFLVMAATLTHIKSKMLLPAPQEPIQDEEEGEDPREMLLQRLLEYEKYKEAALALQKRETVYINIYGRNVAGEQEEIGDDIYLEVSLFELLTALRKVLEKTKERGEQISLVDELSVSDRINSILETLQKESPVAFSALFNGSSNRMEIIVTFLALLELIRLKMVRVRQGDEFGSIWLFHALA